MLKEELDFINSTDASSDMKLETYLKSKQTEVEKEHEKTIQVENITKLVIAVIGVVTTLTPIIANTVNQQPNDEQQETKSEE